MLWQLDRRRFLLWLALIWAVYAAMQILYITRMPMVMDEFEGAYNVHRYASSLPYRDFDPYKTVLGYYIQLPVLESAPDLWTAMLAVKLEMAAAVMLVFVVVTVALERMFAPGALLLASALLVVMSDFAERSADLRVDTLTALAGFVALAALIKRRTGWAGALTAVSMLISQKAAFYVLAAGAVLIVDLAVEGNRKAALRRGLAFGAAFGAVLLAYLTFWSFVSTPRAVVAMVFGTAVRVAMSDAYAIRVQFWTQTLIRNPLYWALAVVAVFALARRWRTDSSRTIAVYGAVTLALAALHKQPWPYFFVIVCVPVFMLHAAFFDSMNERRNVKMMIILCGLIGVVYPLTRLRTTLARDNAVQRWTVEFAQSILGPHDSYFAGVDMVWDRNHEPSELRWIDAVVMRELSAKPTEELFRIASEMERAPIKVVIHSYRTARLPPPIARMIEAQYVPLWGNVAVYGPRLRPGPFALKFDGDYLLRTMAGSPAVIDGRPIASGATVTFARGRHLLTSTAPLRLQLQPPDWMARVDLRFAGPADLYDHVYSY